MVTITLLGEQAVVDPSTGRTLTRSARSIALLGLLVARRGAPQSRSSIAGWFWPESSESQAMSNLRRELHHLRQWIDDDSLEVTGSHLCWHERGRHRVDLAVFLAEHDAALASAEPQEVVDHGTRAVAAYTGDLLPGLDGEWLEQLRDELRSAYVHLCDVVTTAATELGRLDLAIGVMRRRVAVDPYDETSHRRLMELLEESGDRAGAVRLYHRLSGLLERELGVEPDPRTTDVLQRITRAGDQPGAPAQRRDHVRAHLVGREQELERLRRIWRSASAGRVRVALVSGAPGVGKSRLVEELATEARAGRAVTALGRCFESTGRLPLAPIADWLRSPGIAAARSRLDALWWAEVERLVPSADSPRPDPPDATDAWQRHRFVEGLARAVLAPGRPTLLVLDNLQWCDADTLRVITSLLTISPRAPVLVALVARPMTDDPASAPGTWLSDLRRADLLTEVGLAPFDASMTALLAAELVGDRRSDRPDVALLQEATGGFPLFITEALRAAGSPPAGRDGSAWSDILAHRLGQLGPEARGTAALASALNRDFTLPVLTHASDLDPDTVVRAVDELWRQRLVRETGDGYDFSHDLIRSAAYQTITPARRWLLHRRLADALQEVHPAGRDAITPQVAEQYALAGDHEQAVTWFLAAADAAVGVFGFAELLELMERAVAEAGQLPEGRARDHHELECRIRQVRTMISLHGYAHPGVEATALRIVDLAGGLGRTEDEQAALGALFGCYFVRGQVDLAMEVAQRGVALVDGRAHDAVYGHAQIVLGGAALHHGLCEVADDAWASADATPLGDLLLSFHARAETFAAAWWAHAAWARGRPDHAATLAARAIEESLASGHVPSQVVALTYGALTAQLLGDRDTCARRAGDAVRLCERYRITYYLHYARVLQSWCRGPAGAGDLEDALAHLKASGALGRTPYWLALLTDLVEDPAEVRALLDEAVDLVEAGHERLWLPELWRRQAGLAPNDDAARALLADAHELARGQGNLALAERIGRDQAARAGTRTGT